MVDPTQTYIFNLCFCECLIPKKEPSLIKKSTENIIRRKSSKIRCCAETHTKSPNLLTVGYNDINKEDIPNKIRCV